MNYINIKSNTNSIKEAIDDLLNAYRLSSKLDEHRLIADWEKIMGKMIAKHTREIFIKDKILYVKLDSAVLREELSYGKSKLIRLLNDTIGKPVIADIIFR